MAGQHLITRNEIETAISWRLEIVAGDRRDPWTRQCAIKAKAAKESNDIDAFWAAGVEVVNSYRAAMAASRQLGGDALSGELEEFFRDHPDAEPADAWSHFSSIAEIGLGQFADFDGERISFEPAPGRRILDINRETFLRRARRVKNRVITAGQQPAVVRRAA